MPHWDDMTKGQQADQLRDWIEYYESRVIHLRHDLLAAKNDLREHQDALHRLLTKPEEE